MAHASQTSANPSKTLARRRALKAYKPLKHKANPGYEFKGPVDQSGRSPALHAGGPGFKSPPVQSWVGLRWEAFNG
jgi:hypothetical protein